MEDRFKVHIVKDTKPWNKYSVHPSKCAYSMFIHDEQENEFMHLHVVFQGGVAKYKPFLFREDRELNKHIKENKGS